jgi:hypothetical protein
MNESHELLKVLKEFDINYENIYDIDDITYKLYEEILFQYLSDIDPTITTYNKLEPVNTKNRKILVKFTRNNDSIQVNEYFDIESVYFVNSIFQFSDKIYCHYYYADNITLIGIKIEILDQ